MPQHDATRLYLLTCPCGQKMKVPHASLGKTGVCPACGRYLTLSRSRVQPLPPPGPARRERPAAQQPARLRIGELLVQAEAITPRQLEEALEVQRSTDGRLGEILVSLGYIDVKTLAGVVAQKPGATGADLDNYHLPKGLLDLVPEEVALKHRVVPIDRSSSHLTVGAAFPLAGHTIRILERSARVPVRALLCSPPDVDAIIERYYGGGAAGESAGANAYLEGVLKLENAAVLLRKLAMLPARPQTVERIEEAMANPGAGVEDVAPIIEEDQAIAARLLAEANSAIYGFAHRVDDIALAVSLLGLEETHALVLSSAVMEAFGQGQGPFDYEALWRRARRCAAVAKALAGQLGDGAPSGVYAAALLHDLGRAALMEAEPLRYARIPKDAQGHELVAAELAVLGLTHNEAGFILATNWSLPPQIVEPIRYHHAISFAAEAAQATALVAAAAAYVDAMRNGALDAESLAANAGEALALLGLDQDALVTVGQAHLAAES